MTNTEFQLLFYAARVTHPSCWGITAKVPLAIAKQETGNFTSNHFIAHNNPFGMTAPELRETTCLNKGTGQVAVYSSVLDGMSDFFYFCQNWKITDDASLQKFVDDLRYNKNAKYPPTIARIVAQLAAAGDYLPSAPFHPVVVGGVATLTVAGIAQVLRNG